MNYYFNILNIPIELRFTEETYLPLASSLRPFRCTLEGNQAKTTIIDFVPEALVKQASSIFFTKTSQSLSMAHCDDRLLFEYQTGHFLTNKSFTQVTLWSPYESDISMQREGVVAFNGDPTLRLILWGRASLEGYCFMHGALVVIDGKHVLLMGDSGVGKSTLSRLACQQGATCLTDENPFIYWNGDYIEAYTTPWPGVSGSDALLSGPLAAVFFLRQTDKNEIRQLPMDEAVRCLLHNSRTFNWLPETIPDAIQLLDKVVRNVPVYDFGFLPHPSAVDFLKSAL